MSWDGVRVAEVLMRLTHYIYERIETMSKWFFHVCLMIGVYTYSLGNCFYNKYEIGSVFSILSIWQELPPFIVLYNADFYLIWSKFSIFQIMLSQGKGCMLLCQLSIYLSLSPNSPFSLYSPIINKIPLGILALMWAWCYVYSLENIGRTSQEERLLLEVLAAVLGSAWWGWRHSWSSAPVMLTEYAALW